jgi:hypothetical protein
MKRIILILALLTCFGLQGVYSQSISQFIEELKKVDGVETMSLGKELLDASGEGNVDGIPVEKITGMDIIACDDSISIETRTKLGEKFRKLKNDSEYEDLINVKDEGNYVRIVAKKKMDVIEQVLIMVLSDNSDVVVVALNGNFTKEDLKQILEKHDA